MWTESTLRGRNLVEFDIFPHFNDDLHSELVKSKSEEYPNPVRCITDNMVIVQSDLTEVGHPEDLIFTSSFHQE